HTRCLSDWSSDVCSSDLIASSRQDAGTPDTWPTPATACGGGSRAGGASDSLTVAGDAAHGRKSTGDGITGGCRPSVRLVGRQPEIGRASCRERGAVWGGG